MSTVTRERPILFSGPMVRAIIDGTKTQTRRVIDWPKLLKKAGLPIGTPCKLAHYKIINDWALDAGDSVMRQVGCPYGAPGDLLWVREGWAWSGVDKDHSDVWWKASPINSNGDWPCNIRWRPSIHMPRWASRLTLRIADVRVERVQDISEEDCEREGIVECNVCVCGDAMDRHFEHIAVPMYTLRNEFAELWDSINAKRGYSWDANPWCWVVTFERVKP